MASEGNRPLLLASRSPRRAALLRAAGLRFVAVQPRVRERTRPFPGVGGVRRMAMVNAAAKANAAAPEGSGRWTLGADTVVVLGRQLFGKPRRLADAARMLTRLQGRTHRVITAVCLLGPRRRACRFSVTSRVTFRRMDKAAIADYLRRVHVLDKAGAYAAQADARLILRRIEGSWSNVVGLPMEHLRRKLRALGLPAGRTVKRLAFSRASS